MTTLIEFYDKDVIKNTLGVLTIKPDKIIYIYDKAFKDLNRFYSLEKCFKKHIPNVEVNICPVNIFSVDQIYKETCKIIKSNINCIIDLTGGSELMTIAGYKAGTEMGVKLIYTDIIEEKVFDINNESEVIKAAQLTLEDFVDAHGAEFIGNSHDEPEERDFLKILEMCKILFTHLNKWRSTCTFFQVAMADTAAGDLDLRIHTEIQQKDGRRVSPDKDLLYDFQKYGFIKNLYFSGKYVVLTFASKKAKSYLISFGVWLEMFVYIHAVKSGEFQDVKLGTMVDWDAYDGITVAGNEIDVILQDKSMPVFISCKLRAADAAALNELLIEKKRLGGWFSKSIIVSFGQDKAMKNGTYKRAKELGIVMLDQTDVLSPEFGQRLVKAVHSYDLVGLKWKNI